MATTERPRRIFVRRFGMLADLREFVPNPLCGDVCRRGAGLGYKQDQVSSYAARTKPYRHCDKCPVIAERVCNVPYLVTKERGDVMVHLMRKNRVLTVRQAYAAMLNIIREQDDG